MKIEVKKAIKLLGSQQRASLSCQYCGSEIQTYAGGVAICNLCEMPAGTGAEVLPEDPALRNAITARSNAVYQGQWEKALEISKQLEERNEPAVLYGNAVFYACYSEYLYNKVNYSLSGFMEENSANKDLSNLMYMKSKEFLFKALSKSKAIEGQQSGDELYMNALINIKIGRKSASAKAIDGLSKLNYAQIAIDYLKLLLSISSNNAKESISLINKLIDAGETNSIYIASKLLSEKDPKSAKLLYSTLVNKISAFSFRPKPF
ncbi:MAG: hypothetical protein QXL63_01725 [Candidatus Micrarchaeaceae archaeon]